MKLADGIRKHGFRTWYERELLQSHAHLALSSCCLIGVFAAFEAASKFNSLADQITDFIAVLICAGLGQWALRRYLYLLSHAEAVAHQADCPQCATYGRLELLPAAGVDGAVAVRCRKCGHARHINA